MEKWMRKAADWRRLYEGETPWLDKDGVSLGLPAAIASEIARLATVEFSVEVKGGEKAQWMKQALDNAVRKTRVYTEMAAANGSIMLKPYMADGCIAIDAIAAPDFTPTAFAADGSITGCDFYESATNGSTEYVRVESHRLDAYGCWIFNRAYKAAHGSAQLGREVALEAVPQWADLAPSTLLPGVKQPLFAHLCMPPNGVPSPLGTACFARAIPLIREADRQFNRLLWEMDSASRALYVDIRAFAPDEAQPGGLPFKRFYRTMDVDPQADTLFAEWSPQIREASQINALNEILQRVEDGCGLARGTFSSNPEIAASSAKTATELKMMRQRTYATIRDTQKAIETAFAQLATAIDIWGAALGLTPDSPWTLTFEFDDSIVSDRAEAFAERVKLVEMGVLRPEELRAWYLGEAVEG